MLAPVALCEATVGIMLASQESGAGYSDQTEAAVPAVARALPRSASSDDGSEQISLGRDNPESCSFSFQCTPGSGYLYCVLALTSTVVNFMF